MAPWTLALSRDPELMDDPGLPEAEHLRALGGLARINAISGTAARLATAIGRRLGDGRARARPLEIMDVACGGGDVTVGLARRLAARCGAAKVRVVGLDVSPRAVERARRRAAGGSEPVSFEVRDVVADGCPSCDVVVSSLFLHHLDDAAARAVLAACAAAARCGIVVSDLIRSRIGLALAVAGTTFLSRSHVVRTDGPLSVRAARTAPEYRDLFAAAGLPAAAVRRVWPERVIVEWWRPEATA